MKLTSLALSSASIFLASVLLPVQAQDYQPIRDNTETLVAIAVMLLAVAASIYRLGWASGLRKIGLILGILALYFGAIYFFGQDGKVWFAIVFGITAVGVLAYRRGKGEDIW